MFAYQGRRIETVTQFPGGGQLRNNGLRSRMEGQKGVEGLFTVLTEKRTGSLILYANSKGGTKHRRLVELKFAGD